MELEKMLRRVHGGLKQAKRGTNEEVLNLYGSSDRLDLVEL